MPRSWAERAYRKLIYFSEVDKGGHFAAWEVPELFASGSCRVQAAPPVDVRQGRRTDLRATPSLHM